MKNLLAFLAVLGFATLAFADTRVNGYTRKEGTYVPGHYRSSPDGDKGNNWSTKGNINPYTGKEGTRTYGGQYGSGNSYETYKQNNSCRTEYLSGGYDASGNYQSGRYRTICD